MKKESTKSFISEHRTDIIVIASLLLLSIAALLIVNLIKKDGAYAEVTVDGVKIGEYPLGIDSIYTLNNGTNTLTIEGGTAYISYSDCPDHVCERTGKVRHVGETIVCLPNRLTVTITGESDGDVDLVS